MTSDDENLLRFFWQQQLENWLEQHHTETDGAHDIAHFRWFWKTARTLNQAEGSQAMRIGITGCRHLHDIISLLKTTPDRHFVHVWPRKKRRRFCLNWVSLQKINAVGHAIEAFPQFFGKSTRRDFGKQNYYKMLIVWKLWSIGWRGCFIPGRMEREMFDPYDPLAKTPSLDDGIALDHFFVKLYKVADTHANSGR